MQTLHLMEGCGSSANQVLLGPIRFPDKLRRITQYASAIVVLAVKTCYDQVMLGIESQN